MRIAIALTTAALAVLTGVTGAGAEVASGTIAGRIYYQDDPGLPIETTVLVIPVDLTQPVPVADAYDRYWFAVRADGSFAVSGLPDGEYFVGFEVPPDSARQLTERLLVRHSPTMLLGFPALRARVQNGRSAEIEVMVRRANLATPPGPLSPPAGPTGSISGRVFVNGVPAAGFGSFPYVPGDTPEPIVLDDVVIDEFAHVDEQGTFAISGLADGEYLLLLGSKERGRTVTASLPVETVQVIVPTRQAPGGEEQTWFAIRVTVAGGQAVTGIEINIFEPTPSPLSAPGLPATGAADGREEGDRALAYLATALAGAVLLVVVGGGAFLLRRARRTG